MTGILETTKRQGPATLDEIERHVAWLYSTAVRVRGQTPSDDGDARQLIVPILAESEALQGLVDRIDVEQLDVDLAVDVGVILQRALDLWCTSTKRWCDDEESKALGVSAAHLGDVAEVLLDALLSAPWIHHPEAPKSICGHAGRKAN